MLYWLSQPGVLYKGDILNDTTEGLASFSHTSIHYLYAVFYLFSLFAKVHLHILLNKVLFAKIVLQCLKLTLPYFHADMIVSVSI